MGLLSFHFLHVISPTPPLYFLTFPTDPSDVWPGPPRLQQGLVTGGRQQDLSLPPRAQELVAGHTVFYRAVLQRWCQLRLLREQLGEDRRILLVILRILPGGKLRTQVTAHVSRHQCSRLVEAGNVLWRSTNPIPVCLIPLLLIVFYFLMKHLIYAKLPKTVLKITWMYNHPDFQPMTS